MIVMNSFDREAILTKLGCYLRLRICHRVNLCKNSLSGSWLLEGKWCRKAYKKFDESWGVGSTHLVRSSLVLSLKGSKSRCTPRRMNSSQIF